MAFFDQQRVRIVDRLVAISILVAAGLSIVDVLSGLWLALLMNVLAITLIFFPVFLLQNFKKYVFARLYYVIGSALIIVAAVLFAYKDGRFTDTENLLVGFSAVSIFLFDKYRKVLVYILFIVLIISLKWYKDVYLLGSDLQTYILICVNYAVLFVAIFFFVDVYRRALMVELNNSNKLNEELIRGKDEVEQTRGMLYNMVDNIPLLLAMLDNKGRFLAMNKQFAAIMGQDETQLIGTQYQDTLPSMIIDQFESKIENGFKGEESEFDELMKFPNGESQHVFGQVVPLFNDMGVYGLTLFLTDVADLKEKEHKLQQLNDTKNKLFSIIAHDLKNPINLLQGLVYLSKEGGFEADEQEIFIDRIQKNLGSVSHMMENLLLWAKSQLDGYRMDKGVCVVKDEFMQVWKVYEEMALKKGIKVSHKIALSHEVMMDKNHLQMILRNLLNNAIKFTGKGGKIDITSERANGDVKLKICDTGKGMNEETMKSILDRQFVHSEYGTDGESGTGLGLSLCLDMLQQNNASMELKSKEGEGTTFVLQLPSV